jgi:hypothetical protein
MRFLKGLSEHPDAAVAPPRQAAFKKSLRENRAKKPLLIFQDHGGKGRED